MRDRNSKVSDEAVLGLVVIILLFSMVIEYAKHREETGLSIPLIETILRPFQNPAALK